MKVADNYQYEQKVSDRVGRNSLNDGAVGYSSAA
jgi:hypothetical protein